jgi:hypothetical protein
MADGLTPLDMAELPETAREQEDGATRDEAHGAGRSRTNLGVVPPLFALALFSLLAYFYLAGSRKAYFGILHWMRIDAFRFPFLDTHAVLAAIECRRLGFDVYAQDPCDVLGRVHVYSPLWLLGAATPIGTAATLWVGLALDLAFLAALFFMPQPQRLVEVIFITLATLSTSVIFALERANNDVVVFLLAFAVGLLMLRKSPLRFVAFPVAFFAGMLKFYPITLLVLAARERLTFFILIATLALACGAAFIAIYAGELLRVLSLIPRSSYFCTDCFAAKNLPYGLAQVVAPRGQLATILPSLLYAAVTILSVVISSFIAGANQFRRAFARLTEREAVFLAIGSALLVGCFFAGQSFSYRGVHFLFVLPGLLALARNERGSGMASLMTITCGLILLLMRPIAPELAGSAQILFWFGYELAWWWVMTLLTASLLSFLQLSGIGRYCLWPLTIRLRRR